MADWKLTVNLADLNRRWKSGEIDISGLANLVAGRIEESGWRPFTLDPIQFDLILAALRRATSQGEYVAGFEPLYDLADLDRVWIETS